MAKDDVSDCFGADVPGDAVSGAIQSLKLHARSGVAAQLAVAETQVRASIIVDLGDEMLIGCRAGKKVRSRAPLRIAFRSRVAYQPNLRKSLSGILGERCGLGPV